MLFHQFREHLMLALEAAFQIRNTLLKPGLSSGPGPLLSEHTRRAKEELLLPTIEHVDGDPVMLANTRYRLLAYQVFIDDGKLLLRRVLLALRYAHDDSLLGSHYPICRHCPIPTGAKQMEPCGVSSAD